MQPSLPQNDPNPERRQQYLEQQRSLYHYAYDYVPPLAYAAEVPKAERFSCNYRLKQLGTALRIIVNLLLAKIGHSFDYFEHLDDYKRLFVGYPLLPPPPTAKNVLPDAEFAWQRLAGPNPLVIERVDEARLQPLLQKFPVTDALFQTVTGMKTTLEEAAKAGQLYLTDYAPLNTIDPGNFKHWQKMITAPLALFYWQSQGNNGQGMLLPIAIQLHQHPTPNSPIFTPLDEPSWSIAKTWVQIADANHHELISHLARTHFAIAPFVLATARQLADNHPLSILLKPHFQFTLAINQMARTDIIRPGSLLYRIFSGNFSLINPHGFVDRVFAGTLDSSVAAVTQSLLVKEFQALAFPTDLQQRGVEDPTLLPDYPYREDGTLLWSAIYTFVTEYLKIYYPTPEDLVEDCELQNWTHELLSHDGGRIRGLTPDNRVDTLEKLIHLVTQLIFISGPQHAAVNYSQYDFLAFAPNMPLAGYAFPSKTQNKTQEIESKKSKFISPLVKFLPPKQLAISQLQLTAFLTGFRDNRLGRYSRHSFIAPRTKPVIAAFQENLHNIEEKIDLRNRARRHPYPYLKPSLVPNSINI